VRAFELVDRINEDCVTRSAAFGLGTQIRVMAPSPTYDLEIVDVEYDDVGRVLYIKTDFYDPDVTVDGDE